MINKIVSLAILLVFGVSNAYAIKQFTLDQLKENPNFEISISANGNYSGSSVELKIKSNNKKDVEVIVPAGTVFFTADDHHQILIIVEEEVFVVVKGRTKKKILDGYCTEASDGVPGAEMAMAFMPTKREQLQKLANFINENKGFSDHAIQEAVWCVSDEHAIANIYSENPVKTQKLIQFVADLTEQEVPWNQVKRSYNLSDGYIQFNPVLVTGSIHFSTTKETIVKCKIIDEEGNLVFDNPNALTVPKKDIVNINFNLSVAGWSAGNYFVVYYDQDNKTLLKQEFSI
ncbi:MAG: hypothetical protein KDC34_20000 [Saprospiraceae bacterium]|nr:hypothetical protein [Saprospiraceae bacterium]